MPDYHDSEYWNGRYETYTEPFDWLLSYEHVRYILRSYVTDTSKILIVGCGNAEFSADMYDDGLQNITNIDLSHVVISQMKERHVSREKMTWEEMDATDMKFPDNSFDLIVDKGLLDTLVCGTDSIENTVKMTFEVFRCLKPNGVFVAISLHEEKDFITLLDNDCIGWAVAHIRIDNPRHDPENDPPQCAQHTLFVCKKLDLDATEDPSLLAELLKYKLRLERAKKENEEEDEEDMGADLDETRSNASILPDVDYFSDTELFKVAQTSVYKQSKQKNQDHTHLLTTTSSGPLESILPYSKRSLHEREKDLSTFDTDSIDIESDRAEVGSDLTSSRLSFKDLVYDCNHSAMDTTFETATPERVC
eukprot:GILK01001709.1.p1 GENE.GILK01001709.1~~GILK01001709.1.p1  ORF type:complete len:363 (-),score=65.21 GILK01001709.1:107-1195(-)